MNHIRLSLHALLAILAFVPAVHAAADGSTLEIPSGADMAIVVFEDLQCPDCAHAHPQLLAAATANDVPLVIHDFPIKRHAWAFPAAILARYFTLQSAQLGTDFRTFVFDKQRDITPDNLRAHADEFARQHGLELPATVDPDGRLLALVQADYDLGDRIGLQYVPLMFVVSREPGPGRWVEVKEPQSLGEIIASRRNNPVLR